MSYAIGLLALALFTFMMAVQYIGVKEKRADSTSLQQAMLTAAMYLVAAAICFK